jgi:hypothetical protein
VKVSRALAAALAALACATLAACESREQATPGEGQPAARLLVTAGYGGERLLDRRVPPDQSVMRALRGAATVETGYGGAFVAAMFDRRSDAGAHRDWFLLMNGVESDVGARDYRLRTGETAWWDYRDWGSLMSVGIAVGLWPEPFVHGFRTPPEEVSADPPLDAPLRRAGVRLGTGMTPWRVRVGSDAALRAEDPAWRRAESDPDRAGMTAAVEGGRITALAPGGGPRVPVPGARALAVAVSTGDSPGAGALMAVAGLDAAAARAAAEAIARDPAILRERYAVAFDGGGRPLRAAARAGP